MSVSGPDLSGAILSRKVHLERKLGAGSMGSVYAARLEGGGACAVKLLNPGFEDVPEVLERFEDEGRAAMRLVHPNVVRVHEVTRAEDGRPYLVMDLYEGLPLSAYTRGGARLAPREAVGVVTGVLAGLAAAHGQGIVHRDLKPENVFLAREGGRVVPKLLDFGIAKVMDAAGGMGGKTRTGALLGTPAYMSPEQIRSAKDVDARADVWSAGVLLYEVLTGRVAFPAPTEYARLGVILNGAVAPLEAVDPRLAPFAPVVARALAKARDDRYRTALEMASALTAAAGGPPGALVDLPEVPSLFLSPGHAPTPGSAPPQTAHRPPVVVAPPPVADAVPGGTLASARGFASSDPTTPSMPVRVMRTVSTLPSEDLPVLELAPRRGVPGWLVAVAVAVAFAVGLAVGIVAARR